MRIKFDRSLFNKLWVSPFEYDLLGINVTDKVVEIFEIYGESSGVALNFFKLKNSDVYSYVSQPYKIFKKYINLEDTLKNNRRLGKIYFIRRIDLEAIVKLAHNSNIEFEFKDKNFKIFLENVSHKFNYSSRNWNLDNTTDDVKSKYYFLNKKQILSLLKTANEEEFDDKEYRDCLRIFFTKSYADFLTRDEMLSFIDFWDWKMDIMKKYNKHKLVFLKECCG